MTRVDSQRLRFLQALITLTIVLCWLTVPTGLFAQEINERDFPEIEDILEITRAPEAPHGVVFVIYEYDFDAMEWVTPRLRHYIVILRERFEDLPISVVSHGDELISLTTEHKRLYPQVHKDIRDLVENYQIHFHVCGAYAAFNGLSEEDFPDYIDVVPFGPAQIADYRMVGYELIDLGLTW